MPQSDAAPLRWLTLLASLAQAVAACRAALEELRLMFRVAAKVGAPVADDVKDLLIAAVRTGKVSGPRVTTPLCASLTRRC